MLNRLCESRIDHFLESGKRGQGIGLRPNVEYPLRDLAPFLRIECIRDLQHLFGPIHGNSSRHLAEHLRTFP